MIQHYQSYYWKDGKPYGKDRTDSDQAISYRIVTDPYHKRYSLEKYQDRTFNCLVYDSIFLDFRHLNPTNQTAWQREVLEEKDETLVYLIRNQDDRLILIETQYFEENQCRFCELRSVHQVFISTHRMYYKKLKDPFDGVVLYDSQNQPVMIKTYELDPQTGEFSTLLTEEWDMESNGSSLLTKVKRSLDNDSFHCRLIDSPNLSIT